MNDQVRCPKSSRVNFQQDSELSVPLLSRVNSIVWIKTCQDQPESLQFLRCMPCQCSIQYVMEAPRIDWRDVSTLDICESKGFT